MSKPEPARSKIGLRPLDVADLPIPFVWLEQCWRYVADDFTPKDVDCYVDFQINHNAVHFGAYKDGDSQPFGVLSQMPISPALCQGHAIFRPSTRHNAMIAALELGKRLAWRMGYRKISAQVFEDNRLMASLLERVGGIYEGTLLQHTQRGGEMINMISYALLRGGV